MDSVGGFPASSRLAFSLTIAIIVLASTPIALAHNVIDKCRRSNPDWVNQRQQLATCSVGYSGKMTNNAGPDVTNYVVTDPSDDPMDPKPGTLRYAMTHVGGKKWVTFQKDMKIKLQRPLLVSSFTTIDGRGASVHIAGGACLVLQRVSITNSKVLVLLQISHVYSLNPQR